jgi:serine/threonine-protein kinase
MDAARWERVQALFHEVVDLPEIDRERRIAERCADDPSLARDVLKLLAEDNAGGNVLDRGIATVAGEILEPETTPLPRRLGPYVLLRPIGEGGSGVVFLAEQTNVQRRVAIKILRDAWLSPARRERFLLEQRTLAQLTHPAIARLYDADTLPDGTPWFAMELVDGEPLTQACDSRGLSVSERLELFRAVCEAVHHAHQHAIVHRDLKPSNLFVTRDGSVKLLDFGIAQRIETDEEAALGARAARTQTRLRPMTLAYAAPEQVRGAPTGVHTDIHALGVVLYELLTGEPAFDAAERSPSEVERLIIEREPVRPSLVVRSSQSKDRRQRGAGWADLDVLCLTAMQKDPAKRYRSVDALIRDVDHYLRREPLEARPFSPVDQARKFARRHWRPLSVLGVAVLGAIGLQTYYTIRLTEARNDAISEAARTRRIQEFMTGLFEGDAAAGPADTLRVLTLLERGVEDAATLANEPVIQSDLLQTLGTLYQGLGQLDRADSLLARSLGLRRAHAGATDPDVARSLVAIGLLRADQSRLEEADSLVRAGLELTKRAHALDPGALADATLGLGLVQEARGDYEAAIRTLTEAVRLNEGPTRAVQRSTSLTALANCHFYSGAYAEADSLNRVILEIDTATYGAAHPNVASDLANLGAIQQEWGRNAEAEGYFRRSLDIYRDWYGHDHPETASLMTMVARVLISDARLDEASTLLRESLAIRERVFGSDHPSVASTLNELGRIAQQEGRFEEAKRDFRRMAAIYGRVHGDRHYLVGVALGNLGGVFLDCGELDEAERLFREAVRVYGETLPADHQYQGVARLKLGRALLRQGRYAEAIAMSSSAHAILTNQTEPATAWMRSVCSDLIEAHRALGDSAAVARMRAERDRYGAASPSS